MRRRITRRDDGSDRLERLGGPAAVQRAQEPHVDRQPFGDGGRDPEAHSRRDAVVGVDGGEVRLAVPGEPGRKPLAPCVGRLVIRPGVQALGIEEVRGERRLAPLEAVAHSLLCVLKVDRGKVRRARPEGRLDHHAPHAAASGAPSAVR